MRAGFVTSVFLAFALATTESACSLVVGTGGLAGGADPEGGGRPPGSNGGSFGTSPSQPGIEVGDAAAPTNPAPNPPGDPDAGAPASPDASLGTGPTGVDAGMVGPDLDAGSDGSS